MQNIFIPFPMDFPCDERAEEIIRNSQTKQRITVDDVLDFHVFLEKSDGRWVNLLKTIEEKIDESKKPG